MGDFIYEQFKERVKDFGIVIGPEDQDGNIQIDYNEIKTTVNLGNARKSYFEHDDLTHLDKIITSLHESLMGTLIPKWDEASPNLFCMLSQSRPYGDGYITEPIADNIVKAFVHYHNDRYMWMSYNTLKIWNISLEVFKAQCNYNMDILLDEAELKIIKTPNRVKCGFIHGGDSWLNSALLFTKNFKRKIEKEIGWPIYFIMPARAFTYFINVKDRQSLDMLSNIGSQVYQNEDQPLSREIFSMTDKGIRAVDRF